MPVSNSKSAAKKIVIVGGVAAGMSAAARARRLSEDSEIIIFERSGYVSYANCGLPYYLGREIANRDALILQTPETLKERFNLDVRVNHEVIEVNTGEKFVLVRNGKSSQTHRESYDELILAVGAAPIKPPVSGIDLPGLFALRTVEDVDAIDAWIAEKNPRHAVIAGAGFIGLETAEQLACRGLATTLVELEQVLRPIDPEMVEIVHQELRRNGVKLLLMSPVKEFRPPSGQDNDRPKCCFVIAGNHEPIPADLVILGLGVRPEVTLARAAGLTLGALGGIRVDEQMRTSAPHVWAVGDAIEVRQPVSNEWTRIALGGPANRQGRIVADNIFGKSVTYQGTLGTFVLRVFELTVASTGINEEQARSANLNYESIHIHPTQHAGYFPGAERLAVKVIFEIPGGKILGSQIIGKDGVDKRIDIIATAMRAGLTVCDLFDLELAYAPPYGSAKDPLNLVGMVGKNILSGMIEQIQWNEIAGLDPEKFCLIDVRSSDERAKGYIPQSIHIPLPELRKRLSEIPQEKSLIVSCQSGQRAYYACRMLAQHGFSARNLSGGYLTWKTAADFQESRHQ